MLVSTKASASFFLGANFPLSFTLTPQGPFGISLRERDTHTNAHARAHARTITHTHP